MAENRADRQPFATLAEGDAEDVAGFPVRPDGQVLDEDGDLVGRYDFHQDDSRQQSQEGAPSSSSSSPWTFYDARTTQRPRPLLHRSSSLPRALYSSDNGSSIFGGVRAAKTSRMTDRRLPERPMLALSPPSDEQVVDSQPPLSTLSRPMTLKESWYNWRETSQLGSSLELPAVEKDADDPNSPPSSSRATVGRHESTTLTTLSRLFAVQAPTSPRDSRSPSYIHPPHRAITSYSRNLYSNEVAGLPDHLYNRGLLEGRHSDITVNAFGQQYKLHRLVLDRAPFFRSALSEPWLESNARETAVHPEDIDPSITQASFELALKRLYGCSDPSEEGRDAVGLFATGCWLEMQDMIESSIEAMLRQMSPETLAPLMRLVTNNYYGRAGDKILASAKAMLCRDGWQMSLRNWDGIPGDIVREIVGGDGFFIDGEWDRWVLAKRILDRRLRIRAIEAGLVERGTTRKVLKAPDSANLMAVRFDGVYRRNGVSNGRGLPDNVHQWISLYTHPDIEPLLVLLDEGIHYVHLDFEQLQFIKDAKDVLGLPVLPQKVIGDALWQQMELRQKVLNSKEGEMELGISVTCADESIVAATRDTTMNITTPLAEPVTPPADHKGKHKAVEEQDVRAESTNKSAGEEDIDSGSWDGNGKPRKFWIPTSDCNIVMGGNADPVIATSNNTTLQRHANRLSATLQPEDIQWMSDFSAVTAQPNHTSNPDLAPGEVRYTHFPPFRFAAEFANPRLLKEKKRVYSRTVFYAGSLWNIYIQKVASSRSKQLGVYLHRAKERDSEDVMSGTAGLAQGSVDERIGLLEREMILRSERRERREQRRRTTVGSDGTEGDGDAEGSTGEDTGGRPSLMRGLLNRSDRNTRRNEQRASSNPITAASADRSVFGPYNDDSSDSDSEDEYPRTTTASDLKRSQVPALPPYVDARPTIKTYFKIYSPSRGGRMLSVYESAPDTFNFRQSWGWKSSTLMLDDGLGEEGGLSGEEGKEETVGVDKVMGGKLRFMVVIGNI